MEYSLPEKIQICEVGLRDGLQNESRLFSTQEKVNLLNEIANAGLQFIEVGSFVSPKAVVQMANTDEIFKMLDRKSGVEYRALIANTRGVERAAECGCKKVKLNVSASRAHNLANLNRTPAESVAGFSECCAKAAEAGIEVSGSISMPFGSPWDAEIPISYLKEIIDAYLSVGVTEISLSDTAGVAVPNQVYALCEEMKKAYPQITWWLHFHNTRGMGIANIIAGMQAGWTRFDTSFAGVGGCPFVPGAAGNVTTEDVVHMCTEMGIDTGIDLDMVIEIGKKIANILGHDTDGYILKAGKSKDLMRDIPKGQTRRG